MSGKELLALFEKAVRRYHLIGDLENGVVAGLDLEGRLFSIFRGKVVSRVVPQAILEQTTRAQYLNPGGDVLWPAPEGTRLGYEYASGTWRVPPGLTGARFIVTDNPAPASATIEAEIDLINASGLGVPTIFRRAISVAQTGDNMLVTVRETIRYIGTDSLSRRECLLAPWTLCQFDCTAGCHVVFPVKQETNVWDLYDDSSDLRKIREGHLHLQTEGNRRFQIGIDPTVPWLTYFNPSEKLQVKRSASALPGHLEYIDIADAPPNVAPDNERHTCHSVYNDANGFMEVESAGGAPAILSPGDESTFEVLTAFASL